MPKNREKLKKLFLENATPEERLEYEKKELEKKVKLLQEIPPEVIKGEKGDDGKDGKDGKDGSPDTGAIIVKKINELEAISQKQIDFNHIKNFPWHFIKNNGGDGGTLIDWGSSGLNLRVSTLGQITANQNDYALGSASLFRLSSDASRTITGFEGGTDGKGIVLANVGSNNIVIANQSASSGAINRVITGTSGDITLSADDVAILFYDGTTERWRVQEAPGGGGSIDGGGAANRIAYWLDADTLTSNANLTYDGTNFNLATAQNFQIAGATILADAAGTTTLSNIDALDATTETTIEAAIDTLANLTSIQGRTVTLADAGTNAIFGWDDTAGAYENLTQAEASVIIDHDATTNFVANEHIDHTAVTLTAGSGLTGGGDISANRTFTVGAGTGITVNADDVAVNQATAFAWTAAHTHTVAGLVKTLTNSNDGASSQVAIIQGDRATMADNDEAYVTLRLSDDAGTQTEVARLTWVATDVNVATSVDGRLDFSVMTAGSLVKELQLDGAALSPSANDGLALGTTALGWADLHLATGGVINWANGEVTLTETDANTLTLAGATSLAMGTSIAVALGTIELGHATDTTLSRSAAGILAVGGVNVVDVSSTQTLTNKTLTRPTFTNPAETTQTLTDGANIAWNLNSGGFATVTLGGNRTLDNPTNMQNGGTYVLIVKQDATGSRTLVYGNAYQWAGGTDPVLSTAVNAVDIFSFVCDGSVMYGNILKAFAV